MVVPGSPLDGPDPKRTGGGTHRQARPGSQSCWALAGGWGATGSGPADGGQGGAALQRIDGHILDEIRDRVDIVDVIADYVPLRRSGKNFVGLCPFHRERTPSFTVAPDKQMFYCFGCQTGGDVFAFLMKREGWSFPEAAAELARRAGVALPQRADHSSGDRDAAERERLRSVLELAAAFFRQALRSPAGAGARHYLAARGIDESLGERYGLGYAPDRWDALLESLRRRGIAPEHLEAAGLVQRRATGGYYDRFRHRVMFPIRDPRGRVVGFAGRSLGDDPPKYLNSPETVLFRKRRLWFGLDLARPRIRDTGRVVVVEGYMDVMAVDRAGIGYAAVASLGTSLSREQAALLARYATEVILAYDGDEAGRAATLRAGELLEEAGLEVRVAQLPAGRDPDELFRTGGADALRHHLDTAVPLVEYRFARLMEEVDTTSVQGRARAVVTLIPWLARVGNPVAREEYVRRYAAALGVDEAALWRQLRRAVRPTHPAARPGTPSGASGNNAQANRHTNRRVPVAEVSSAVARAERGLLSLCLQYPECLDVVAARLDADDWSIPAHRALFGILQQERESAAALEPERVVHRLRTLADTALAGRAPGPSATGGRAGDDTTAAGGVAGPDPGSPPGYPPVQPERTVPAVSYDQMMAALAKIVHEPDRVDPGAVERILNDYIKTLKRQRLLRIQRRIAQLEASGQTVPMDLVQQFQLLSGQLKGRAGG